MGSDSTKKEVSDRVLPYAAQTLANNYSAGCSDSIEMKNTREGYSPITKIDQIEGKEDREAPTQTRFVRMGRLFNFDGCKKHCYQVAGRTKRDI